VFVLMLDGLVLFKSIIHNQFQFSPKSNQGKVIRGNTFITKLR
jgi:hypothetical protein